MALKSMHLRFRSNCVADALATVELYDPESSARFYFFTISKFFSELLQ